LSVTVGPSTAWLDPSSPWSRIYGRSVHTTRIELLFCTGRIYGLECFHLGKADLQSLDFTFNRLCMKLFKTGSIDVVKDCLIVSVALL